MQITMLYSQEEWATLEKLISVTKNKSLNGYILSRINKLCESGNKNIITRPSLNKIRHNVTIRDTQEETLTMLANHFNVTHSRLVARFVTDPILFEHYLKTGAFKLV